MEDETGYVNLIVWNRVAEAQRAALLERARLRWCAVAASAMYKGV